MFAKKFTLALLLFYASIAVINARGLRKTPKIYNALITTDESLTSSRAYPVIQPTIHESGIAHAPFGPYNSYTLISPPIVRFGQPLVPGLGPQRLPYTPFPDASFPATFTHYPPPPSLAQMPHTPESNANSPTGPAERTPQESDTPAPSEIQPEVANEPKNESTTPAQKLPNNKPKEQLPITLNEYGLPPSLIPISQQYPGRPINLPPYAFNPYSPLFYNQLPQRREFYLPPYNYLSQPPYALQAALPPTAHPHAVPPLSTTEPTDITDVTNDAYSVTALPISLTDVTPSFEDIKNGGSNKNIDVPDVPPPPIPAGPKRSQPEAA